MKRFAIEMIDGDKHHRFVREQKFIIGRHQHTSQLPRQQADTTNQFSRNLICIEAKPAAG
jgi:hypothetical protein